MTNTFLAQYKAKVAELNSDMLAVAYKATYENKATPQTCLDIILDRIIELEGLEYTEGLIEELI